MVFLGLISVALAASTSSTAFRAVVSVKEWGAVGDGVTDDADAVQMAVDNITSGQTLLFPPGVYLLGHQLLLMNKRDMSLAGVGRATCRPGEMPLCQPAELRMATDWIKGINPQVPGAPKNRMINIAGSRSIIVRDLVLNGQMNNTQPSHMYNGYGIGASVSTDVAFLGLSVKNLGGEGLMGEGAVRLRIEDCVTENVNHAINTYSESTFVTFRKNVLRHNSFCILVEGSSNVDIEGNICEQQAAYNQTFYPYDPKQPGQPANVTEPKGGIVLANNAQLGTLDNANVIGNIVKSNRLDNSNGIWLNGDDGGGNTTYFGNVNVIGNQVHNSWMYGIKAEGKATAGVVLASANQIHDCNRANEPEQWAYQELNQAHLTEGGGIMGVHVASGNFISTQSKRNTHAIKASVVAIGNYLHGFEDNLFDNVSSASGNWPKSASERHAAVRGPASGVLDVANKDTIVTGADGAVDVGGERIAAMANGVEGQLVTLIARGPTTLVHGSHYVEAAPILTHTGSDKPLAKYQSVRLLLDGGSWHEIFEN